MTTPPRARQAFNGFIGIFLILGLGLAPGLAAAAAVADALFEQVHQSDWVQVKVDLAAPAQTDAIDQTADDLLSALPPGSYQAVTREAGSNRRAPTRPSRAKPARPVS